MNPTRYICRFEKSKAITIILEASPPELATRTLSPSTDTHVYTCACPNNYLYLGPSKGVSCVVCRSFCNCSVACSIVLNVAVAFEQKLKLYVGLVMLHAVCRCANCRDFPDNFCRLSALWKWSVATFSDRVACRPKSLEGSISVHAHFYGLGVPVLPSRVI